MKKRTARIILIPLIIITFSLIFGFADDQADVYGATAAKPAKQVIQSLQPGNKKLTVQWTVNSASNSRYEVWIARDKNFTKDLVKRYFKNAKRDYYTKKSLVNGRTYYVKVRTYYWKNGKKVYGSWSSVKSVKVKNTAIFSDTSIRGVPELLTVKEKDDGDLLVLVNKYFTVSENYKPADMVTISSEYGTYYGMQMKKNAYSAYKKMIKAAQAEDLDFEICSAYRTYYTQQYLFNSYYYSRGAAVTFMLSAYPGRSEHHTGFAIDLVTGRNGWVLDESFAKTKEGKWIKAHCAEYGFIIRYPKNKTDITGYSYEPWHLRYVGKTAAKKITSQGITLEEYLGKVNG